MCLSSSYKRFNSKRTSSLCSVPSFIVFVSRPVVNTTRLKDLTEWFLQDGTWDVRNLYYCAVRVLVQYDWICLNRSTQVTLTPLTLFVPDKGRPPSSLSVCLNLVFSLSYTIMTELLPSQHTLHYVYGIRRLSPATRCQSFLYPGVRMLTFLDPRRSSDLLTPSTEERSSPGRL